MAYRRSTRRRTTRARTSSRRTYRSSPRRYAAPRSRRRVSSRTSRGSRTIRIVVQTVPASTASGQASVVPLRAQF